MQTYLKGLCPYKTGKPEKNFGKFHKYLFKSQK